MLKIAKISGLQALGWKTEWLHVARQLTGLKIAVFGSDVARDVRWRSVDCTFGYYVVVSQIAMVAVGLLLMRLGSPSFGIRCPLYLHCDGSSPAASCRGNLGSFEPTTPRLVPP
jgi:hypothetical protein